MARSFDFEITKDEYIKLSRLLHDLALMSDLDEVQQANFIWSNLSNRNMFGYSLDSDKMYYRILRERNYRFRHNIK